MDKIGLGANGHQRQGGLARGGSNRDDCETGVGVGGKRENVDYDCSGAFGCEEVKIKHRKEEDKTKGKLVVPKFPDEEQGPSGSARNQKRDDKEGEINGETDAQRKYREVRNREKRVGWENHVVKDREKKFLCNSFRWDEADAKVRSYIFLCLGAEG